MTLGSVILTLTSVLSISTLNADKTATSIKNYVQEF